MLRLPLITAHLVKRYLKVLLFSLIAFIAIMMITRLDDIAKYSVFSPAKTDIFFFTLYQVAYIVPLALPIASLIAAVVLFRNLSKNYELLALRTAGMSLRKIIAPLLLVSCFLSLGNLYIVSELATEAHFYTKKMRQNFLTLNPFIILQNTQLLKMQGTYANIGRLSASKLQAENVLLAAYNPRQERINLFTAKELRISGDLVNGDHLSLITSIPSETASLNDTLIIENQEYMTSSAADLSLLFKSTDIHVQADHLSLVHLRTWISQLSTIKEKATLREQLALSTEINKGYVDIIRRFSLAISVFTFTLLGAAFGTDPRRYPSQKRTFIIIALAALFLICFFMAKNYSNQVFLAGGIYLIPHVIIIVSSIFMLKRTSRGIESC